MKKLLATLDRAPLYWVAVGLGLLVFGLNRLLPPDIWSAAPTEQGRLDSAFVEVLRAGELRYEIVPGFPQTFGSHVLSQSLVALVSTVTGDAGRAGIWLSLVGVVGAITGLYVLAIRIHAFRGFALGTVLAGGAVATLHNAVRPDPSVALGMALVVWGMAFFLTAVTEKRPHDVFVSGLFFGLAGYIRIELSLIWVFLAVYLIALELFHGRARKYETSAASMALGGLVVVLLVLWPMVHRNMQLAGTPLLPGYDAELILGAPVQAGERIATPFSERLLQGLYQLTISPQGPGVFVGLLWPIGIIVCLFLGRHEKIPYFWMPVLIATLVAMAALSWVTGQESFLETLKILSLILLPFAFLPMAFVLEQVLNRKTLSLASCRWIWTVAVAGFFLLVQLPHFLRNEPAAEEGMSDPLVIDFAALPTSLRHATLVSDRPGSLLQAGKRNVIGTRGQTEWTVVSTATATGDFRPDQLLEYLDARDVQLIHLSDPKDPLVDKLRLADGAPEFQPVSGIRPPHRLFSISRP